MEMLYYLNNNNINICEQDFKNSRNNIEDSSINQMKLIAEIQKKIMGNNLNFIPRINSSIGKEIESKKVYLRKNIKYITDIKNKSSTNYFESYIVDEGENIINIARGAIDKLVVDDYLSLIRRSMERYEVTLGRSDEGSLRRKDNGIIIRTTRYMSYNMIENDCYSYIRRMKRRYDFNSIDDVIKEYILEANLSGTSYAYIKLLSEYPIESIKTLLKIKDVKDRMTEEQWIEQINISKKIDGLLF